MSKYLLLFLLLAGASFAWLSGWNYMTPVNISSASALTDYQVQIDPKLYNNTGLVGSWHFSEGAGTIAADSSGYGNDGTASGTTVVTGKSGNGLLFNGLNAYVDLGNAPALDVADGTISMWVYINALPASEKREYIWNNWGLSTDQIGLGLDNTGKVVFLQYISNSPSSVYSPSATVAAGNWYHIVASWGSGGMRLYVNNVSKGSNAATGHWGFGNYATVRIGGSSVTSAYFNGTIDEVRIYNRVISGQEISDLYSATKARLDSADLRFTQMYSVYEVPISVSGTGSNLTDYQVLINITNPTILSHMRTDGADLRLFSSATSTPYSSAGLSYWIESINSTQATVWVKANIPASGTTLYMYYGNASASAQSNASATFIFFDDFNRADGAIGNGWTQVTGAATIYANKALLRTTGVDAWAYNPASGAVNDIIVTEDFQVLEASQGRAASLVRASSSGNWISDGYGFYYFGGTVYLYDNNAVKTSAAFSLTLATWYSMEMRIAPNDTIEIRVWQKGTARPVSPTLTWSGTPASAGTNIKLAGAGNYNTDQSYVDNYYIRKYSATEPSATTGAETAIASGIEALLNYWLESDKSAWVKVPSIPAGASSINMLYGNASAVSTSNGTNTFPVFNFDGFTEVDPSSYLTVTSSRVNVASQTTQATNLYKTIGSTGDFSTNFELYVTTMDGDSATDAFLLGDGTSNIAWTTWGTNNGIGVNVQSSSGTKRIYIYKYASGAGTISTGIAYSASTPYYLSFSRNSTTATLSVFSDPARKNHISGSPVTLAVANTAWTKLNIANNMLTYAGARAYYIQNLYLRKYAQPEPSVSSGVEQQPDITPPAVSISSPNASVTYSSVSVPLNFTATDASGVSSCKYELNGVNTTLAGCENAMINASSGSNSLTVWAYDGTNWGSASLSFNVQLDNTPPVISITSPENISYSSSPVPVNFVVSDPALDSCIVRLNNTINSTTCNNYSLSLGNGAYTLNITANDTFGNVNSSAVSFTVNLTVFVLNSTITGSNGIGNVSLNGIPSGATHLAYSVGSNAYSKSFSVSTGVSTVRFTAKVTLKGTPAPYKTLTFQAS